MNGLPATAFELVVTEKEKFAVPATSVLLYRTVAHGSGPVAK
jgi:hypothetical protein